VISKKENEITLNRVMTTSELKRRGHIVNVDSRPEFGDDQGPSPMELY
jgi:hypothetical protein